MELVIKMYVCSCMYVRFVCVKCMCVSLDAHPTLHLYDIVGKKVITALHRLIPTVPQSADLCEISVGEVIPCHCGAHGQL